MYPNDPTALDHLHTLMILQHWPSYPNDPTALDHLHTLMILPHWPSCPNDPTALAQLHTLMILLHWPSCIRQQSYNVQPLLFQLGMSAAVVGCQCSSFVRLHCQQCNMWKFREGTYTVILSSILLSFLFLFNDIFLVSCVTIQFTFSAWYGVWLLFQWSTTCKIVPEIERKESDCTSL